MPSKKGGSWRGDILSMDGESFPAPKAKKRVPFLQKKPSWREVPGRKKRKRLALGPKLEEGKCCFQFIKGEGKGGKRNKGEKERGFSITS